MNRKNTPTVITLSAPLGKQDDLFWVELLREGTWHYDNPALPGGKFSVTSKDLKEFKKNYDNGVKGYLLPVNNEHSAVNMKEAEKWTDGKPLPQNVVGWLRGVKEGKSLTGSNAIFGLLSFEDPEIKKLADNGQVKFVSCELNLSWANPEDGNKPYKVIEGVAITARPYIKRMAPMKKVSRVGKPVVAVNLSETVCQADDGIIVNLADDAGFSPITEDFLRQFGQDNGNYSFLYPGAKSEVEESPGMQDFGRATYLTPSKEIGDRNSITYRDVDQAWRKALGASDSEDMKRKLMSGDFDPTMFKVDSDNIKYNINNDINDENFGTEEAVGNKGFALNPDLLPKPNPSVTMLDMSKFNMMPYDTVHPDAGKVMAHTLRNLPALLRNEASIVDGEIAEQNKFPIAKKENAWRSHDPNFLRELANHHEMDGGLREAVAKELEGRNDMSLWDAELYARKALTPTQEHHGPHYHEFNKWAQDKWQEHGNSGWPQWAINHHMSMLHGPALMHHGYDGITKENALYGDETSPPIYAIHNKNKISENAGFHMSEGPKIDAKAFHKELMGRLGQLRPEVELTDLYHGTGEVDSIIKNGFDPSYLGKGNDQYGPGFYFTNQPKHALPYVNSSGSSPGVIHADVRIKNPIRLNRNEEPGAGRNADWPGLTKDEFHGMLQDAIDLHGKDEVLYSNWGDPAVDSDQKIIERMRNAYVGSLPDIAISDMFHNAGDGLRSYASHSGYDGVVITGKDDNGNDYPEIHAAWFPEQIRVKGRHEGFDDDDESMYFSEPEEVEDDVIPQVIQRLKEKYPDAEVRLNRRDNGDIRLEHLAVAKDKRKQGIGSQIMQDLANFADANGVRMTLTTGVRDPHFGTTSRARLSKFYKRFGFIDNRGRNKDFSISDNMLRVPTKSGGNVELSDGTSSTDTHSELLGHRQAIANLAQGIYNDWSQDGDGSDDVYGSGGICDAISGAIGEHLASHGFDVHEGSQEGDDHSWTMAVKGPDVFGVDIPHHIYESGGGYSWKKLPGVKFGPEHVHVFKIDGVDPTKIELGDTVYRGEGQAYDRFDPDRISNEHAFGRAVYATTSKQIADMYADGPQANVKIFGVPDNFKVYDINSPATDAKALVNNAIQDAIDHPRTYRVIGHINGGYISPNHRRIMEDAQDFLAMQPDGLPAHRYLDSLNKVMPPGEKPFYAGVVAHNHMGSALSGAGYDAAKYKDFLDDGDHTNYAIFNIHGLNDSLHNRQVITSEPPENDVRLFLMSATHIPRPLKNMSVDFSRKLELSEGSTTFYKAKEIMNGMVRDPGVAQTLSDAAIALGLPTDLSYQIMMDWEKDSDVKNAALLAMLGFGMLQGGFNGTVDDAAGMILQRANYDAALLAEGVILPAYNKLYEANTPAKLKFAEREGLTPIRKSMSADAPLYARHVEDGKSYFMGNPLLRMVGPQVVPSQSRVKYHKGSDNVRVAQVEYPHPDFDGASGLHLRDSDEEYRGYAYTTPSFYDNHGVDIAAKSGVTDDGVSNIINAAKRSLFVAKHQAKAGASDMLRNSMHFLGFVDGDWTNMKPDSDAALYAVMGHRAFRPVMYANMGKEAFLKFMKGHFTAENLVKAHRDGVLPKGSQEVTKSNADINRAFLSMSPTEQATAKYDKQIKAVEKQLSTLSKKKASAPNLQAKLEIINQENATRSQLHEMRLKRFESVDAMADQIGHEQRLLSSLVDPTSFEDAEQDRMAQTISQSIKSPVGDDQGVDDILTGPSEIDKATVMASLGVSPGILARHGITRRDVLHKAFGDGFETQEEAELNSGVPDQFQWNGASLSRVAPMFGNGFEDGNSVSPTFDKATKSLFRSFHVRGASNGTQANIAANQRMRHLVSSVAAIDASLSHLFKKVAVVVNASKHGSINKDNDDDKAGAFYDPLGHAIHIGGSYVQTVPHEVFHALDNCLAQEVFGNTLDPDSIGIDFLSHAYDALRDPTIMARLKTKIDPDRLEWAKSFTEFVNGLSNHATFRADIDADTSNGIYSVTPHEIFARFGASFHAWATGGMSAVKLTNSWGDQWPEHRFKRFVKLLQWRSLIDSQKPVVSPPEPASAEAQEPYLTNPHG